MGHLREKARRFIDSVRPIVILGLPVVITGYSSVIMQVTDAYMVGHLGSEELAAVTPAGLIVSLILVFGAECLTAVIAFVSTAVGKEAYKETGRYAWQGIYVAVALGIGALLYWPTAEPAFHAFFPRIDPRVRDMEILYFQINLLSVLPQMVSAALGSFFVGCYMTKVPMAAALFAVTANALLNYALIFGVGSIPAMGFAGSAWSTVGASFIQMLILLGFFLLRRDLRGLGTRKWRPCKKRLKRLLTVGVPSGVQGCLDLLSWGVLLSWLIGHFHDHRHLAAQTILTTCIRFSFLPADGMASALTSLVGFAQGERDFLMAKRLARAAFQLIALYMTVLAVVYYLGRFWIMRAFTDDVGVIEIGAKCMIFVAAFQYFDAMNVTYINALQGAGDTAWPTALQLILSAGILLGGGLLVIHRWPELESMGVWLVAAIYVFFQGLAFRMRWAAGGWRRIRLLN